MATPSNSPAIQSPRGPMTRVATAIATSANPSASAVSFGVSPYSQTGVASKRSGPDIQWAPARQPLEVTAASAPSIASATSHSTPSGTNGAATSA